MFKIRRFLNFISPCGFFILFILLYSIFYFFFGERIPVNGGLGWDGSIYGYLVKNFYRAIFVGPIPYYYVQRILPSAIVHFGLKILHLPTTVNVFVIGGFYVYNSILFLLSAWIWGKITRLLKLNNELTWLSFIALFINYFILKQSFYYPVLTDVSAFFLAVLILYFYLKNWPAGILISLFFGAFSWPLSLFFGLPLYLFPYKSSDPPVTTSSCRNVNHFLAVCICLLFLFESLVPYLQGKLFDRSDCGYMPLNKHLIFLSIFCVCGYLYGGTKEIWRGYHCSRIINIIKNISFYRIIFSLLLPMLVFFIVFRVGSLPHPIETFGDMAYLAIGKPFIFLLGNLVFFGPVLLLTLFFRNNFCARIRCYGPGMVLFIFLTFVLSIDPEGRHLIFSFPFIVAFTIKSLEGHRLSNGFKGMFVFLSFAYSKTWFIINKEPFYGSYLTFPYQNYYMNQGPWISDMAYVYQGAAVLLSFFLLDRFLIKGTH